MPELTDFKKHRKHRTYLVRQLGDNGAGPGEVWVEVIRADGYGFGSMLEHLAEGVIEKDKANPAPATGYKLEDLFPTVEGEPEPDAPVE